MRLKNLIEGISHVLGLYIEAYRIIESCKIVCRYQEEKSRNKADSLRIYPYPYLPSY